VTTDSWPAALRAIGAAPHPPRPWRDGTQLPWNDADFSARVLPVHLDPATHMASRSPAVIRRHVAWLRDRVGGALPAGRPPRVLDLGCGPGLYCLELARAGWRATGIDFSPAAIAHARAAAAAEGLACTFLQADLTELTAGQLDDLAAADVATFWFGEFHSFRPPVARALLRTVAGLLRPGGLFVLEYQPWDSFVQQDEQHWQTCDRSVFCDEPHLWLQEHAWDEEAQAEITVHWIVEAATGRLRRFAQCHQAYEWPHLAGVLADSGFAIESQHPPIAGIDPRFEFPVLVCKHT
jgi:SAM-dependent methyltransferase